MTTSTTRSKYHVKNIGSKLLVLAFWLVLWQLAAFFIGKEILLPTPIKVAETLGGLILTLDFWLMIGASILRIMAGMLIGVLLGVLFAILTSHSKFLDRLFSLPLNIIKATPVASFIILALVWLSTDGVPMFCVTLMVIPIIWSNVAEGIRHRNPQYQELARAYHLSRLKKLQVIDIPQVLPYFIAALKTSIGFSWKSGIAAEVIALPAISVGNMLYRAKIYLETPDLLAWTVVIIILSILIENLLVSLLNKSFGRFGTGEKEVVS